jgi:hypothetical protein
MGRQLDSQLATLTWSPQCTWMPSVQTGAIGDALSLFVNSPQQPASSYSA